MLAGQKKVSKFPSAKPAPPRSTILVIEDSNITRNILREELEAEGYLVQVADDGPQGLQMARDFRPDIVLTDVELPAMPGTEVCRRIKEDPETRHTPVLMLSARNELKDKLAGFEAGADDYLAKPFFTKELVARLKAHLRVRESLERSRQLGQFYLEMLFGFGSTITSPFSMDDEVEIVLRQALHGVRAKRGSILLTEEKVGELRVASTYGYRHGGPEIDARHRVSEKLPIVNERDAGSPVGISIYEDTEKRTLFVPMVARERLIGGIEIDLAGRNGRVTANEQKMLHALASQGAVVIENARLERDVRSMFLNIIVSLAGAVDAKDAYTHGHSMRVARTALVVAQQLGLPRQRQEPLLMSAILHDVGKIAIPDKILQKPGRLTKAEFELMKGHTTTGAKMLAHIPALEQVVPGIRNHHEHWDGSGYPDGLAGDAIPQFGRIILIGDAFDAMTTDRVYRRSRPVSFAMDQIREYAGRQFDPDCAEAALEAYRQGRITDDTPETTPTVHELIEQLPQ